MRRARQTRTGRTRRAAPRPIPFAGARGRGLLGRLGKQKRSQSQGSRKAPALLAVVAGLGAGAAALKRRRGGEEQPSADVPPVESATPATAEAEAGPPAGAV